MDFTEKKDVEQETIPETMTYEEFCELVVRELSELMCEKIDEYVSKHPEKKHKYKINFRTGEVEEP